MDRLTVETRVDWCQRILAVPAESMQRTALIQQAAAAVGVSRVTVYRWLIAYSSRGRAGLGRQRRSGIAGTARPVMAQAEFNRMLLTALRDPEVAQAIRAAVRPLGGITLRRAGRKGAAESRAAGDRYRLPLDGDVDEQGQWLANWLPSPPSLRLPSGAED